MFIQSEETDTGNWVGNAIRSKLGGEHPAEAELNEFSMELISPGSQLSKVQKGSRKKKKIVGFTLRIRMKE